MRERSPGYMVDLPQEADKKHKNPNCPKSPHKYLRCSKRTDSKSCTGYGKIIMAEPKTLFYRHSCKTLYFIFSIIKFPQILCCLQPLPQKSYSPLPVAPPSKKAMLLRNILTYFRTAVYWKWNGKTKFGFFEIRF